MRYVLLFILTCVMLSCGKSKSRKIEKSDLDPKIEKHGERIMNDFVTMSKSVEEFRAFKQKGYITPLVHRSLMPDGIYYWAPQFISLDLGGINSFKLYEVHDLGLVYHMRYQLDCPMRQNEFVELAIDISKDLDLSKIYLKVENNGKFDTDKKYINLFSDDILLSPAFKKS